MNIAHLLFILFKTIKLHHIIPYTNTNSYYPIDIGKLYNFPLKYSGKNQKIATIIFNCYIDSDIINNDIRQSFSNQNINYIPHVNIVNINNATNFDPESYVETALDTQIISSIAPNAQLTVYNFDYNYNSQFYINIYDAINQAIKDGSTIISISLGGPEVLNNKLEQLFKYAVSKNINIYVSSGDNDSDDGSNTLVVNYPASSPNVISCGGTTIEQNTEIVWNNYNDVGTGGGYSKIYRKPIYQNKINTVNNMRGVPDIAANADPNTGYNIYVNSELIQVGGTSAVAPLMAGLNGLLNESNNKSIGFLNNIIYKNPLVCYDITIGNNYPYQNNKLGYVAKKGWDACTGYGRIDGTRILNYILKH